MRYLLLGLVILATACTKQQEECRIEPLNTDKIAVAVTPFPKTVNIRLRIKSRGIITDVHRKMISGNGSPDGMYAKSVFFRITNYLWIRFFWIAVMHRQRCIRINWSGYSHQATEELLMSDNEAVLYIRLTDIKGRYIGIQLNTGLLASMKRRQTDLLYGFPGKRRGKK